jgi:hypothetical protein
VATIRHFLIRSRKCSSPPALNAAQCLLKKVRGTIPQIIAELKSSPAI